MDVLCIAGAIILVIIIFLYYQNNKIDITYYDTKSDAASDDIIIVHLSDMHSKPFDKVVEEARRCAPDIIAITGDYINDHCRNKEKMLSIASRLTDIAPVFYITGNHEHRLDTFDTLMAELGNAGFTVLLNKTSDITIGGTTVNILGLDENQANFDDYKARREGTFVYKDMSPYFSELTSRDGVKIVLSHYPENFEAVAEQNYSQYDFDLQLSGHAHGGQFILPLIGPVFSPGQGIRPRYARGEFGTRPKLIVSRGLGNAEFPFRLFNHPQINVITIHKNDKNTH